MPSSPRLRLYRIIRPSLVLSQSFADRRWCGQNREVVDNGQSRDQFGLEGPEVSSSAACCSPAVRDQAGDPNPNLEAPPRRQYVISLAGGISITASDGETRHIGAGEIVLVEDTTGKGHITRSSGDRPRHTIFVPID
jgi:hypothetical protein